MACGLEHQFIVGRLGRLQQEHLDQRSCILAKMHTGLNNLRIVEHHQRTHRQIVGQMIEHILTNHTFIIYKEFGVIALGDGEFGDTLIGERIIIVANANMTWIRNHMKQAKIRAKSKVNTNTSTGRSQSLRI